MATIVLEHLDLELLPISEIAVVRENDAEWRVYIEWLRFFFTGRRAGRRITDLTNTRIARQRTHVARTKHVAYQAVGLVHAKRVTGVGCNTRSILSAMLKQQQRIVDQLVDGTMRNDADYATHGGLLNKT